MRPLHGTWDIREERVTRRSFTMILAHEVWSMRVERKDLVTASNGISSAIMFARRVLIPGLASLNGVSARTAGRVFQRRLRETLALGRTS